MVRVLSLSKAHWEALAAQFPQQARLVLENLQGKAEQVCPLGAGGWAGGGGGGSGGSSGWVGWGEVAVPHGSALGPGCIRAADRAGGVAGAARCNHYGESRTQACSHHMRHVCGATDVPPTVLHAELARLPS